MYRENGLPAWRKRSDIWRALVAIAVIAATGVTAHAEDCDALTARFAVSIQGVKFVRKSTSGFHRDFSHPDAESVTLHCGFPANKDGPEIPAAVTAHAKNSFPPSKYFDLVGTVGRFLTGLPADVIRKTAMECHQEALADADKYAFVDRDRVEYRCNGAGNYIQVNKSSSQ